MNALTDICAAKREYIAKRKREIPESTLLTQLKTTTPPRGFKHALEQRLKNHPFALIAEIKKASPSAGLIRPDFNPAMLAKAYQAGGAACLSALTDEPYFQGCDAYLQEARVAVNLPVLRKDFMLDPYQVIESRTIGADCILIIIAALDIPQAKELESAAFELGMDVLVEVHDRHELELARTHLSSTFIGVNNRNLKTLKVDLATAETLAKDLAAPMLPVCESGLRAHADLKRMKSSGFSCFLVGESLMREADVTRATKALLGDV